MTLVLRRYRTLSDTAMLASVLVGFVAWSVGGWRWLVPPLTLFFSYTIVWPRRRLIRQRAHDVDAVGAVTAAGFGWMVLASALNRPSFYYLFTLSFAAHLAFFGIRWLRIAKPRLGSAMIVVRSVAPAWLVLFVPYAASVLGERRAELVRCVAVAPLCLIAGALAFRWLVPAAIDTKDKPFPWWRQAALGFATSALGIAALAPI